MFHSVNSRLLGNTKAHLQHGRWSAIAQKRNMQKSVFIRCHATTGRQADRAANANMITGCLDYERSIPKQYDFRALHPSTQQACPIHGTTPPRVGPFGPGSSCRLRPKKRARERWHSPPRQKEWDLRPGWPTARQAVIVAVKKPAPAHDTEESYLEDCWGDCLLIDGDELDRRGIDAQRAVKLHCSRDVIQWACNKRVSWHTIVIKTKDD
jgi:hypothetical protein